LLDSSMRSMERWRGSMRRFRSSEGSLIAYLIGWAKLRSTLGWRLELSYRSGLRYGLCQSTSRGRRRDVERHRDRGTTRKASDTCVRDLGLATLSWLSFLGGLADRSTSFDYCSR